MIKEMAGRVPDDPSSGLRNDEIYFFVHVVERGRMRIWRGTRRDRTGKVEEERNGKGDIIYITEESKKPSQKPTSNQ